jgi:hypothetical protein
LFTAPYSLAQGLPDCSRLDEAKTGVRYGQEFQDWRRHVGQRSGTNRPSHSGFGKLPAIVVRNILIPPLQRAQEPDHRIVHCLRPFLLRPVPASRQHHDLPQRRHEPRQVRQHRVRPRERQHQIAFPGHV